ncbi:MAG TPA: transposase family protein, partial [Ktedonobacteraceae bacterium]|nr:transposase family protein [Ktedonobacteraceae bacterium]
VLTYLLLAKAAGETTLQAIAEWIRLRGSWLQEVLPEVRPSFPCAATYSNVLRAADAEQLNHVLMELLTRVRTDLRDGLLDPGWVLSAQLHVDSLERLIEASAPTYPNGWHNMLVMAQHPDNGKLRDGDAFFPPHFEPVEVLTEC